MHSNIIARLKEFPLFSRFERAWDGHMGALQFKSYSKDALVCEHGSASHALWMVASGWFSLGRNTPDGKSVIVGLCTRGDVFGEAALFPRANYPYSAECLAEGSEVVAIPASLLQRLLAEHNDMSHYVMELLGERISHAQLKLEHMTSLTAPQRLGCFLLRLCHTQFEGSHRLSMPVEKHLIASYLGMKPETLSRSFQQLGQYGVIVHGPEVEITNIGLLREFVCGSCSELGSCSAEEAAMQAGD